MSSKFKKAKSGHRSNPKRAPKDQVLDFQTETFTPSPEECLSIDLSCKFCAFQTSSALSLEKHTSKCPPERSLEESGPPLDPEEYSLYTDYLEGHYLAKMGHFDAEEPLLTEKALGTDKKVHECEECHRTFANAANLRRHVKTTHREDTKWFECDRCPYKSKLKHNLNMHRTQRHSADLEWFECEQCPYRAKISTNLTKHVNTQHKDEAGGLFECDECSFKSKWKHHLKNHRLTVHCEEVEWYECDYCSYRGKKEEYLRRHLIRMHKDEKAK